MVVPASTVRAVVWLTAAAAAAAAVAAALRRPDTEVGWQLGQSGPVLDQWGGSLGCRAAWSPTPSAS